VQATVATFDPGTGSGTVLTDDGRRIPYGADAFAAGGLRLLRFGQRVRLEIAGDGTGRVVRITIATLP
jgi:2-phospho-L-lactate guanylyltransferase